MYSGETSREKTSANFKVLWLFAKVFSAKLGAWHPLAVPASNLRNLITNVFSHESFPLYGTSLVSRLSPSFLWLLFVKCDLRKGPTSRNFECIASKAAYLRNTVSGLNETWVVYTGDVAEAINWKWSHSVEPQWRYGAELMALLIAGQFLENGSATQGAYLGSGES